MFSQGKFIFWEATKSNSILYFSLNSCLGQYTQNSIIIFLNSIQFILADFVLKVNSHTKAKERIHELYLI
jgi:hypothetical protein